MDGNGIHPAPTQFSNAEIEAEPILRFFHYTHLPTSLQQTSKPFCDVARHILHTTPRCAERSVAFRKLLEAKDAAVRANVLIKPTTLLDRLRDEHAQVSTRLLKLTKFSNFSSSLGQSIEQARLLEEQRAAMEHYQNILNARIAAHSFDEENLVVGEIKTTGRNVSEEPLPFS